jgi:hypothetical protein
LIAKKNIIVVIASPNCSKPTKPKKMIGPNSAEEKPPKRRLRSNVSSAIPGVNAWARENIPRYISQVVSAFAAATTIFVLTFAAKGQTKITVDHNTGSSINPDFKFKSVPTPARDDPASKARVVIVDGEADSNSAGVNALTDGILPASDDQPRRNFFIAPGSGGARILMDLGRIIDIAQINSYSWHPGSRGPQVYRVWGSDGSVSNFIEAPKANVDPRTCGWKVLATVDTRSSDETQDGGQWGVSITDAGGSLGRFRYLLFDCYVTEVADDFGNTFYSEIDVVAKK